CLERRLSVLPPQKWGRFGVRRVNKIVATASVIFLCTASFAIGHSVALRKGAAMVLDNTKMIANWRESDWTVSSIRYAKMIRLMQTKQYDAALDQACQAIAKDLKNIREIADT